jgi:ribose transport system permease protein
VTTGSLDPEIPSAADSSSPRKRSFRFPEELGVILVLLAMVVFIGVARPLFLNPINLLTILGHTTFLGMLAIGMVFLLAIREIDLSVGWMFNFSATITALLMVAGVNPWLSALAGFAFGAFLGLFNGVLSVTLRLPAIIVTLGTYSMFQGLSLVVNRGRAVVPSDTSSSFFTVISSKLFGVIPVTALVFVVLAIVMHFVLHRSRFGYRVQAVGSNPEAAELAGIANWVVRLQTLVLMGAICGLSGAMYVGFRGAVDPNLGSDFVLAVIAAVIIGGTPLSGGAGTVIGAVVGMLIIQVIRSGLIFFGIEATWSTFVTGAVIVIAVALDQVVKYQRTRRAERIKAGSPSG